MAKFRLPKGSNSTEAMMALARLLLVAVALTATLTAADPPNSSTNGPPQDGPSNLVGGGPGPVNGQGTGSGEAPIQQPGNSPGGGGNLGDGGAGQKMCTTEEECREHCDKTLENGSCRKDGVNIVCYCQPRCPSDATEDVSDTADLDNIDNFCANNELDEDVRNDKCCSKCKYVGSSKGACITGDSGMVSCQCDRTDDISTYVDIVNRDNTRPDPCAPTLDCTSPADRDAECFDQCQIMFTQKGQCKPDGPQPEDYKEACFCEQFGYTILSSAVHQVIESKVYAKDTAPNAVAKETKECGFLCQVIGYKNSKFKVGKNKAEKDCSCLVKTKLIEGGDHKGPNPEPKASHLNGHGKSGTEVAKAATAAKAGTTGKSKDKRVKKEKPLRGKPEHIKNNLGTHFVNIRVAATGSNDVCSPSGWDNDNNDKCNKECTKVDKKGGECKLLVLLKACYCEENPVLTRLIQPPVDNGGPDASQGASGDQGNGSGGPGDQQQQQQQYSGPPGPPPDAQSQDQGPGNGQLQN